MDRVGSQGWCLRGAGCHCCCWLPPRIADSPAHTKTGAGGRKELNASTFRLKGVLCLA